MIQGLLSFSQCAALLSSNSCVQLKSHSATIVLSEHSLPIPNYVPLRYASYFPRSIQNLVPIDTFVCMPIYPELCVRCERHRVTYDYSKRANTLLARFWEFTLFIWTHHRSERAWAFCFDAPRGFAPPVQKTFYTTSLVCHRSVQHFCRVRWRCTSSVLLRVAFGASTDAMDIILSASCFLCKPRTGSRSSDQLGILEDRLRAEGPALCHARNTASW